MLLTERKKKFNEKRNNYECQFHILIYIFAFILIVVGFLELNVKSGPWLFSCLTLIQDQI